MSLLLHLSDLHLAADEDDEDLGDYKSDVISRSERQRRVTTLRQTLRALNRHQRLKAAAWTRSWSAAM